VPFSCLFLVSINDDLDRKIADAFSIFDHHGQKTVDVREVGSILRFLGMVPTEQEVSETIAETEFAGDSSGTVHLSKFLPYVKNLIIERRMEPVAIEKLLEAFQVLDYDGKGFVTRDFMAKIMMEEGEPFSLEELEEMFSCAVDSSAFRIPYEYYLNQLIIDI
jgi:Ca2+-binding EF-hand superfamily protein